MSPPLRVGSVPYLNARPLVHGLDADPEVVYSEAVPSALAVDLERGAVDVALVSSIERLRLPGSRLVASHGIVSDGPVWSVLLVGEGDPLAARTVALDGASLTAATLTRITYARFLGRDDVRFVRVGAAPDPAAPGADATLIIGDAALQTFAPHLRVVDLGELWTRHTGLPFVWAAWLARPGFAALEAAGARLDRAAEGGLARITELARRGPRYGVAPDLAARYLTDAIRFPIDERARAGLDLFLEWGRDHAAPTSTGTASAAGGASKPGGDTAPSGVTHG